MAQTKKAPVEKALFPFKENEKVLDKVAAQFPVYAYPEHNLILFEGSSLDLQIVSLLLYDRTAG